jgi:glycine cleavage system H protein
VIEVNEEIESNPELVNTDPYGEGWMIKIQIASPEELDGLLNSADYSNLI